MQKTDFKSLYKGKIIEVINYTVEYEQGGVTSSYVAEIARRSPGVRLLIIDKPSNKIMLTKEKRIETANEWDYRLPGGKVFDRLDDYLPHASDETALLAFADKAADKECAEEAGLRIRGKSLLHRSSSGATVTWDLYYFLVTEFVEVEQDTEEGETIHPEWFDFDMVKKLCLDGSVQEDRSVAVILKYLLKQNL